MKIAIKILVKIILISFGFDVVVSQELKKGMTFDDVEEVWGKPKSISEPKYYNKGENSKLLQITFYSFLPIHSLIISQLYANLRNLGNSKIKNI